MALREEELSEGLQKIRARHIQSRGAGKKMDFGRILECSGQTAGACRDLRTQAQELLKSRKVNGDGSVGVIHARGSLAVRPSGENIGLPDVSIRIRMRLMVEAVKLSDSDLSRMNDQSRKARTGQKTE